MSDYVSVYQWISIVGYICAGLFFLSAMFLFFYFNIPQVFGYLTKRTERKAIEAIRNENEKRKEKSIQETEQTQYQLSNAAQSEATSVLANETTLLGEENETTVLGEVNATTVLIEEEMVYIHTDESIN